MRSRTTRTIVGVVATVALLAGCSSPSGDGGSGSDDGSGGFADMEPVTLIVSDPYTKGSSLYAGLTAFIEAVEEGTEGKVTFERFESASLHAGTEGLSALESGLTDITFISPSWFREELPALRWSQDLGVLASPSFPQQLLSGTPAFMATMLQNPSFNESFASTADAVALITWTAISQDMLCAEPVQTPADARGKLIYVAGYPYDMSAEALGMQPVFLQVAEQYEALQRGVVDCVVGNPANYMNLGLMDIAKYYVPASFGTSTGTSYLIRRGAWEQLPPAAQQVVQDARAAFLTAMLKAFVDSYILWAETGPAEGVEFLDPAPLNEAIAPAAEERADALLTSGEGVVTDREQTVDFFVAENAAWLDRLDALGYPDDPTGDLQEQILAMKDFPWDEYENQLVEYLNQYPIGQ